MSHARRRLLKKSASYAAGLAAVVLTFCGRQVLVSQIGTDLPQYVVFFPAITFTAVIAGLWAGLLATLCAAFLVVVWVLPVHGHIASLSLGHAVCLGIFVGAATVTCIICDLHRRARRRAAEYERQVADQQVEEVLRRYELLAEHSRDIILFVKRGGGRILEANAAAVKSYGYTREELLNLTIHDLRASESQPFTLQQLTEADSRGIRFEGVQRRKDGSTFPVEGSSQGALIGDTKVLISVIRDVTERKRTEQAIARLNQDLQRRAAELQAIFDTAPIGLSLCQDAEGRHIKGNPAIENLLGLQPGEELSLAAPTRTRFRAMTDGRELQTSELPMQRAVRGESISGSVIDVLRPDGGTVTLYASAAPLFDEQKRPRGAVGAFLDITPLRLAEKAVQEASEHRRLAMEGAELGCWEYRVDTGVSCDERCRRLLGFPYRERIDKEDLLARLHPEDRDAFRQAIRQTLTGPDSGAFHYDFRVIWPDGSLHWLAAHARAYGDATGEAKQPAAHLIGIVMDITESRKAEDALRQSQQWLSVTLTSIGDAVIAADDSGRITFLNPAASALTGWSSDEAAGQSIGNVFRIFDEETGAPGGDIVMRVLSEGCSVESAAQTALIARSGRLIPIDENAAPIRSSAGDIVGVVLVFHDATEERRAEKALRQSEERYRRLVDLSPNAIYVHRKDQVEFVNPAALRLLGASSAEQIIGKSPLELFDHGSRDSVRERIGLLRRDEPLPLMEHKILRLDGKTVDVEVTASCFVDQYGPAIQVIMHDITGRRQREEQARVFNRTLKALNNSNQALLRATSEESLLEQVCRIITEDCGHAMVWIGFAENDEGKSVRPVAYSGFEEGYLETLKISWADTAQGRGPTGEAIRTGQPCMCRDMRTSESFEPWRAEALKRGYQSSLVLPLIAEGKAFGAITLYSRKTDAFSSDEVRILMELASDLSYGIGALRLRAAHELAEEALIRSEKLASVGRMAATIAHEINNPLAAVMNTLYLARSSSGLPEQARQYLDVCDAELRRISHITRQALGFYRESTAPALTCIGSILDSVVELLASKITAKRVLVDKQYDQQIQVMAVAGELRQVFSNLFSNSLDAIAEGGTIKLRVSSHSGSVRITVADNGKGITAAARPHIFEAFFTTKDAVGTGLGLWVSRQIIEKHGGSIGLRSSTRGPHRGTSFTVVLPSQAAGAAAAQTAAS